MTPEEKAVEIAHNWRSEKEGKCLESVIAQGLREWGGERTAEGFFAGERKAFARIEAVKEKYKHRIELHFPVPHYLYWRIEVVGYKEIIGETLKEALEKAEEGR